MNSEPKLSTVAPEGYQWIAEAAYYKALARGLAPGHDREDWMEAKKEFKDIKLFKKQKNSLVLLI
jgi:hypothetical protein